MEAVVPNGGFVVDNEDSKSEVWSGCDWEYDAVVIIVGDCLLAACGNWKLDEVNIAIIIVNSMFRNEDDMLSPVVITLYGTFIHTERFVS